MGCFAAGVTCNVRVRDMGEMGELGRTDIRVGGSRVGWVWVGWFGD